LLFELGLRNLQLNRYQLMTFLSRTLPLLLGIFLLSVLVRLPQLNRPLSKHHEFCTAVALRVISIWSENGIDKYGFNPVMTYNNAADKNINNHANASGKMIDTEGNYYYVSHPPFAYYFPFFIFSFLHITPDVLPLQLLNMMLHLLSAMFVYFTVCLLSFNRARSYPHLASVVAFTVYLFLPPTLWFQGNVYMSDMLVHTLFVVGVYTTLKMIIRRKFYSVKYIFFYVVILFLMIYTSWLGLFFAFGVLVYSLLHVKNIRGFNVLIAATVVVSLVVLRIIIYQYSQINGAEAYLSELMNRYLLRGSLSDTKHGLLSFVFSYFTLFGRLIFNYVASYFPVYVFIALFGWVAISKSRLKIVFSENGYRFIWLSVLPVLLIHALFLNYSIQDFTVLYASLFFSVLLGILYDKIKKSGTYSIKQLNAAVVVFVLVCIGQFYLTNKPGDVSIYGSKYADAKKAGEAIAKEAQKEEVIFVIGKEPEPQEVWYAKRNMLWVKSEGEAMQIVSQRNLNKAVLFNYDEEGVQLLKRLPL
jgi:hypothetical protein